MESITTCEVCYVNYDTKDHAPRVLPCGHTMCTKCLTNILNNPTLRRCSYDNIAFAPNQNSATSLPLNFVIINMLEQKKNNACKAHPDERLKFICLTDRTKICYECAKHDDHKDHNVKKIKALKAQGVKIKEELQQSLLNIEGYEHEKERDCEQGRKAFVRTITEQFKEIKETLVEKEFELVQQANSLFNADWKNIFEETFAWKQQIDETIKDITYACQDENGDMMILEKEVSHNDQNTTKRRTQFLREKSSRVQSKALEMQKSLKDALMSSKTSINSLQLSTQDLVQEIYSVQEESAQLSQEELTRRQKSLKCVKFASYFDIVENEGRLKISAKSPQLKEVEVSLADIQAIEKIEIDLSRYDTLRKDPIPSVLSSVFRGLRNLVELNIRFEPQNFSNNSLLWLAETIRNHTQSLKILELNLRDCKLNVDSMIILDVSIFSQTINLQTFSLILNGCQVLDEHLKILVESLKTYHKNLKYFAIGLRDSKITSFGVDELFQLIRCMDGLGTLLLNLFGFQGSSECFKILGETVLPNLQSLHSLYLWLERSTISDEYIALILKNLPNLSNLDVDLSQTSLTDKTVEMLIEEVIPRLEPLESFSFNLEETAVNQNNIDRIQNIADMITKRESTEEN